MASILSFVIYSRLYPCAAIRMRHLPATNPFSLLKVNYGVNLNPLRNFFQIVAKWCHFTREMRCCTA
jgi:hypothetical protein